MAHKSIHKNTLKNYISKDSFYKALDNLCEINQIAIESKLAKAEQLPDLDTLITAQDKDIRPLLKQYCNKTGLELRNLNLCYMQQLVQIHGKEKTLELLRLDAVSQYSSLWLQTDSKTLNKLMIHDVAGYFVYAASHIFHSEIVKKSNLHKMPPHSPIGKASQENDMLKDFLADFPQQDKPEDLTWSEIPESSDVRYFNLQDKIIARRNCDLYLDDIKITKANELLRKFLGLAKPQNAANLVKFSFHHLHEITDTPENLNIFIAELKQAIKDLFLKHFKSIKHKKTESYKLRLVNAQLSYSDIAKIKANFAGLSNFHSQPKIRNHTKQQSIMFDLRGFWDKEAAKDKTLQQFRGTGKSKLFDDCADLDMSLKGIKTNHYKLPAEKKGSFQLKIKKSEDNSK